MNPIRLAVIGAGHQCTEALMPAIPFLEEFDLVAICDLQKELAQRNAAVSALFLRMTMYRPCYATRSPKLSWVVGPPQMHEEVGLQSWKPVVIFSSKNQRRPPLQARHV
jgi:predicted dehydrogenase